VKVCLACGARFRGADWTCPACGAAPAPGPFPAFAPGLGEAGFEAGWFEPLASVEADSFWFRARNRLVLWALEAYFPTARSLLEIGCGTGFVLSAIRATRPELAVTGGDAAVEGLRVARRRLPGVSLLQLDARRLPFECEFDVVGAFDVLEHIEEDEVVLGQMHRATKPGGGAIVLVPQHPWLWSAEDDAGHKRRYRRRELRAKLEAAGFELVRGTSFVSLLLPLMVASRRLRCGRPGLDDPVGELRAAQRAGWLLERVLDLERAMIARGARLPAGGSLLAIARKGG
jgi:SAM-dependent methyltransferase